MYDLPLKRGEIVRTPSDKPVRCTKLYEVCTKKRDRTFGGSVAEPACSPPVSNRPSPIWPDRTERVGAPSARRRHRTSTAGALRRAASCEMVPSMFSPPIRASSHEPKRPTRLPARVKAAILLMVYGDPARPDQPIDFVAAAKACGVQVDHMRRWLHRPEAASMLRRERAAYRLALCAGNENALARIRDQSENAMAVCKSVQLLDQADRDEMLRPSTRPRQEAGLVILIQGAMPSPSPTGPIVDVTPAKPRAEPGADREPRDG